MAAIFHKNLEFSHFYANLPPITGGNKNHLGHKIYGATHAKGYREKLGHKSELQKIIRDTRKV